MSWQTYVDSNLVGSGKVTQAAICGVAGGQWAGSTDFNVSAEELKAICDGFNDPSGLQANGIRVNGVKYLFTKAEDNTLLAKKGNDGVTIRKTQQAIIIGVYDEKTMPMNSRLIVEGLGDYLVSVNYVSGQQQSIVLTTRSK